MQPNVECNTSQKDNEILEILMMFDLTKFSHNKSY